MEIRIATIGKGKAAVIVEGSQKNSPKQIAQAYIQTVKELEKEGVKCQ